MTRFSFDNNKGKIDKDYTNKEYTPDSLVTECISLIPYTEGDIFLDAGSGFNKVWFKNFPEGVHLEYEISEGKDFILADVDVDWIVGNPPYDLMLKFIEKSTDISKKGFGFLINHSRLNQLTPVRLDNWSKKGFWLSKIHICSVKHWFGRFYFVVFTKVKSDDITFNRTTHKLRDVKGGEG